MSDALRASRSGLHMALVYTTPLVLWILGQGWLLADGHAQVGPALQGLFRALLLVQVGALALCVPWLLRYPEPGDQLRGLAMLLLTPLPLYSVAWAAGEVEARNLGLALAWLCALACCLYVFYRLCLRLAPAGQFRALLVLSVQVGCALLLWNYRTAWLGLLGG